MQVSEKEARRMADEGKWYQPPVPPGGRDTYYVYGSRGEDIFGLRSIPNYDGSSYYLKAAEERVRIEKSRRYSATVACYDNVWWTHCFIEGAFW